MILGISASGRPEGITDEAIKTILEASELDYEYISLAGKNINGCIGCTRCAADNRCKQIDDWNKIGEKMLESEVIIFGAPNYYGTINALGHACLERTYSFRHQGKFCLKGKAGIAVGVDDQEENSVLPYIKNMMVHNKMKIIDDLAVDGYSQCYTCGFGHQCEVGSVVPKHGFLDEIKDEHLPPRFCEQEKNMVKAKKIGQKLKSIL